MAQLRKSVTVGDKLWVREDLESVRVACKGSGGFVNTMKPFLGKEGKVVKILPDRVRLEFTTHNSTETFFWGWAAVTRRIEVPCLPLPRSTGVSLMSVLCARACLLWLRELTCLRASALKTRKEF